MKTPIRRYIHRNQDLLARCLALLWVACLLPGPGQLAARVDALAAPASWTTLIVKLRAGAPATAVQAVTAEYDGQLAATIPQLGLQMLAVPAPQAEQAMASLRSQPSVAYAEPNHAVRAVVTPDDPDWAQQWGPVRIGAPAAWEIVTGTAEVVIAIVDTGIDLDHPDLQNKLWVNAGEVPGNLLDDDGNGKVDDVHGWHLYTEVWESTPVQLEDGNVQDDHGHGSHVAGIAGAEANNGIGVAGLSWGARLMAVKVLDEYGNGEYWDLIAGIVYAADNGARIINMSLGGDELSPALQEAVDYAYSHGALVVAATGNTGGSVLYPAACANVLAVAATGPADEHAGFSSSGPEVDLAAPGVSIYSTWPWRTGYWTQSGTSMATPFVSGLAALIWSQRPGYTPAHVQALLVHTALDLGEPGRDDLFGWGRIDAARAVAVARADGLRYLPLVRR